MDIPRVNLHIESFLVFQSLHFATTEPGRSQNLR